MVLIKRTNISKRLYNLLKQEQIDLINKEKKKKKTRKKKKITLGMASNSLAEKIIKG